MAENENAIQIDEENGIIHGSIKVDGNLEVST